VTLTVSATEVREYLQFDTDAASVAASSVSTTQIESNILAAQEFLERATRRWFVNRPAVTYTMTSMTRAIVPIPGFRAFTTVTWGGAVLVVNQGCWPLPDVQNTGIYTAIQFRAIRADMREWWLANPLYWDQLLDSPFFPGNYGGGYAWTSMPNDLVIVGDGGYATYPMAWLLAVKQLASFYTKQPAAILAETIITAQGGVINYAALPSTVQGFIASWRAGQMAISVG
jgi:hypothetical protein